MGTWSKSLLIPGLSMTQAHVPSATVARASFRQPFSGNSRPILSTEGARCFLFQQSHWQMMVVVGSDGESLSRAPWNRRFEAQWECRSVEFDYDQSEKKSHSCDPSAEKGCIIDVLTGRSSRRLVRRGETDALRPDAEFRSPVKMPGWPAHHRKRFRDAR
jgi:hypothetical protein